MESIWAGCLSILYVMISSQTSDYDNVSYGSYGLLIRDFFEYIAWFDEERQFWHAPWSNSQVIKDWNFTRKARRALTLSNEALTDDISNGHKKWKMIFWRSFPNISAIRSLFFDDTEEFIEDSYSVDIRYNLIIDCKVTLKLANRNSLVLLLLWQDDSFKIQSRKTPLEFYIKNCDVPWTYEVKWKVRNTGSKAIERNQIRWQILDDKWDSIRIESADFQWDHYVECYVIKDNVCVARDKIEVPIS